jgi:hypothetical protein
MTFLSHVRILLGQMVQRTIDLLSLVQKVQVRRVQTLLVQALLDLQVLCEHASQVILKLNSKFNDYLCHVLFLVPDLVRGQHLVLLGDHFPTSTNRQKISPPHQI